MKRIRLEVIFHVADSVDEHAFADRLDAHIGAFRDPGQSANRTPHYESFSVQVERRTWEDAR